MIRAMEKAEKIFWGIALVAGFYIVASGSLNFGTKVDAQATQPTQQVAANQAAPMKGVGCMAGGGGCGCGGMMKKQ